MSFVDVLPAALAFGAVAVLGLIWFTSKNKNVKEILFFRPRDKRGERLVITKETDRSVFCERSTPVHHFIKIGPAFTFKDGGKTVTRFLGIEGTAYTAVMKGKDKFEQSIETTLRLLWGNKIYEKLPQKMREAVEKDKIGITIEPEKIDAEALNLEPLSSDEVNDEGDATILDRLAKFGAAENMKQKLMGNLIWLALGFALCIIITKFIPIGG